MGMNKAILLLLTALYKFKICAKIVGRLRRSRFVLN